jgi:DNA-binding NarL/FixJ family response regulator
MMNVLHLHSHSPSDRVPSTALVADSLVASEDQKTAGLCHRALGAAALVAALPKRQHEVLRGMVAGLLNKQIAYLLGISEKTVKMHRAQLLLNLGTPTTAGAVRLAVESSFAPLSQDYLAKLTDG